MKKYILIPIMLSLFATVSFAQQTTTTETTIDFDLAKFEKFKKNNDTKAMSANHKLKVKKRLEYLRERVDEKTRKEIDKYIRKEF